MVQFHGVQANGIVWVGSRPARHEEFKEVWIHTVMSYDEQSGASKMYVNGNLILEKEFYGPVSRFHHLLIGTYRNENSRFMKGVVDEVSVWDRALAEDEVIRLHRNLGGF